MSSSPYPYTYSHASAASAAASASTPPRVDTTLDINTTAISTIRGGRLMSSSASTIEEAGNNNTATTTTPSARVADLFAALSSPLPVTTLSEYYTASSNSSYLQGTTTTSVDATTGNRSTPASAYNNNHPSALFHSTARFGAPSSSTGSSPYTSNVNAVTNAATSNLTPITTDHYQISNLQRRQNINNTNSNSNNGNVANSIINNNNNHDHLRLLSDFRNAQIAEEQDHQRCSQAHQRALLAEQLESLKQIAIKELPQHDWMFTKRERPSPFTVHDNSHNINSSDILNDNFVVNG